MSRIRHSLVDYDRLTERVAEEFAVPDAAMPLVKKLACVPTSDPHAVMCYPLDATGAPDLAAALAIDTRLDTDGRDYFLEGFADPVVASGSRPSRNKSA